jgi:ferrochelatase
MPPAAASGVLLVNLGTPEAPTPSAVRRYLREFLWDPRVVEIPRPVWWVILNLFVLTFRPAKTARKYASIWTRDGSPLRVYHDRQVQLLRGFLAERHGLKVPVAGAMRYGKPTVADGLALLRDAGCTRVVVIPMYPQYAASTTASVNDALGGAMRRLKYAPAVRFVEDFHDFAPYAKAVARNVNDYWMKTGRPDKLLMSFHGLPQRTVDRGDPYQRQCLATARAVATELGWNDARTVVSFQSRFGAQEWLKPYTVERLEALGREGTGRVDVICPGFTADCLETLEEIAQEGRDAFKAAGGKDFHYIPTTNDTPAWMTALAALAARELAAAD